MTIHFSAIPGVMFGFELVSGIEEECSDWDDDSSSHYIVLDLLLVRILIEY